MSQPTGISMPLPPKRVASQLLRPYRFAVLGDSTSGANSGESSESSRFHGSDWPTYLQLTSKGRFQLAINKSVSGASTAAILGNLSTVLGSATNPDICFVLGGANDADGTPTLAESKANLQAIYTGLIAAGIQPIALTQLPNDSYSSNTQQRNAWIKAYCLRNGIPCIDVYSAVVDASDGGWNTTYSGDGVHPNAAGHRLIASTILAAFDGLGLPYPTLLCTAQSDATNLVTNGCFVGDANADGVADNWTKSGSAGTHTWTLEADASNVLGNWQQDVISSAGLTYLTQTISSGWSVGDRLYFCGKYASSGAVAGSLSPQAKVIFWGANASLGAMYLPILDVDDRAFFGIEGTVPSDITSMTIQLYASVGTGTLRFGQVTLVNLTTLGVV